MADRSGVTEFLSGNEAFARGAIEHGVRFCASYPGTPSTEITAGMMRHAREYDIYCEWSSNEKVALEAAAGASWLGIPSLCPMKSLGLNVSADFLLNVNLSGSGPGGLVVIVCDDPNGHSSSNEQDSRFYAKAAQLPLLEPATCQQAKDLTGYALDLSRREEIPVLIRSTTRLSHSRSLVTLGEVTQRNLSLEGSLPGNLFNVPNPHLRHRDLLDKIDRVSREFDSSSFNRLEIPKGHDILLVASGVCQRYCRDAADMLEGLGVGQLGLATTYPLPRRLLASALGRVGRLLYVEETDPFVEDEIRAFITETGLSVESHGKRTGEMPKWGETSTDTVLRGVSRALGHQWNGRGETTEAAAESARDLLISRPLTFCAGCTHRNVFWALKQVKRSLKDGLMVLGDIGCYSLGVFYDRTMETMQAMGSGIGTACGIGQLGRFGLRSKVVAVAGDSTFFHACLPALANAVHKGADITFLVLDNRTTAMTGFQTHPGLDDEEHEYRSIDIETVVKGFGPDRAVMADSEDIPATERVLRETLTAKGVKVVILKGVCRLLEEREDQGGRKRTAISVDKEKCRGEKCRICVGQYGCSALSWDSVSGRATVIDELCVRCGSCVDVCPHGALRREE